jgi:hypothetical protein
MEALSSAADMEHVGLAEALELVLLLLNANISYFAAVAPVPTKGGSTEPLGRLVVEAQVLLAALAALPSSKGAAAARALAELLDRRGFERAGEPLIRWSDGHATFGQLANRVTR